MIYNIDVDNTKKGDISVLVLDEDSAHQAGVVKDDTEFRIESLEAGAMVTIETEQLPPDTTSVFRKEQPQISDDKIKKKKKKYLDFIHLNDTEFRIESLEAGAMVTIETEQLPPDTTSVFRKEQPQISDDKIKKKKKKYLDFIHLSSLMDDEPLETDCCKKTICCGISLELYCLATLSLAALCLIAGVVYILWKINGGTLSGADIQVMINNSINELSLGTTIGEYIDLGKPASSDKIRIKNESGSLSISTTEFIFQDGTDSSSIIYSSPNMSFDTSVTVAGDMSAESVTIGSSQLVDSGGYLSSNSPISIYDSITLSNGSNEVTMSLSYSHLAVDNSVSASGYVSATSYISAPTVNISSASLSYSATYGIVSDSSLVVEDSIMITGSGFSASFSISNSGVSLSDSIDINGSVSASTNVSTPVLYLGSIQLSDSSGTAVVDGSVSVYGNLYISDGTNTTTMQMNGSSLDVDSGA
ncbi:hypothetical protein ADUPG1_011344, partial [Aduncisulcus paluster]